jgi:hypothetical protein
MMLRVRVLLLAIALGGLAPAPAQTAQLRPYQVSPAASVSQDLGICSVRIDYHRPAVRGRAIWGALVPYGQVWRAGANEATVITLSHPARIEGHELAAGAYALFAIPGRERWTLVFNREARQWGAFNYHADQDAMRLEVTPVYSAFQEYLGYSLQVAAPDRLRVQLAWEKLAVGFDLAMDVQGAYWAYLQKTLAEAPADAWQTLNQAVNYCLLTDTHLDQALAWAERSIAIKEGTRNLELKAKLLRRSGRKDEASALLRRAIAAAQGAPANTLKELQAELEEWEKQP